MKQAKTIGEYNINLMFWLQFFSSISFLTPILTLFYTERGLSATQILIVLMFWSGAVLVGEIPTGIIADYYGAKISFFIGALLKIISMFILLTADAPWMFYLYSFINGVSVTFFSGADEALIYDSLKEDNNENKMDQAMGKIQSAGFISMIVTVLFGAYLANDLKNEQFILLILLGIIFYMVELFLIGKIQQPLKKSKYRENPFYQVKEGIRTIKKAPQLLFMFLNVTLVFIPAGAVYEYFNQPLMVGAGLPVYFIGILYSFAAVIGYFASRSIGWLTTYFSRVFLMYMTGFLAFGGLILSAIFADSLWIIIGAFFLLRWISAVRYPIYSQLSNDLIPSNIRATTISLLSIVDSGLDLVVFGILSFVAISGYTYVLIGCSVIALIGTLLPIHKWSDKNM